MIKKSAENRRIVVYLDKPEMLIAEKKASAVGHKNVHRWGAAVIKKELGK